MSIKKPEMVLLDVDGTLVDSVPDLSYAVDLMLEAVNLPPRGEKKVRSWVGNGIEKLVKRALTDNLEEEPEPALFERAFPLFLEIYADNTCKYSRMYDGAKEGLQYLKQNGFKIGCVTNKREQFTKTLLKTLGIYDIFGIIINGDTLPKKKPDSMPLLHAADYFSVSPEVCVMVGDSRNDIDAARATGFRIICVSYGYSQGEDIRNADPDAVIDSLAEISDLLH